MNRNSIAIDQPCGRARTPGAISCIPRNRTGWLVAPLFVLSLFAFGEFICRFAIGLGDPPLYRADPAMEYLLQPSRSYERFHKRFAVNRYGMRSEDFPPRKSAAAELRVVVVGDSIVNAGARIDQSEIATEILRRELQSEFGVRVVVGNASAKSWGPPNELAYLERYGTLDADAVVLELSSHDYADSPTFIPVVGVSADYPDRKPMLALADLLETYVLPRYLGIGRTPAGIDKTAPHAAPPPADIAECREAERSFFRFARAHGARVALAQHLTRAELAASYEPGYSTNQAVAREENVPFVDDAGGLRALLSSGVEPYFPGDPLHLSETGQTALAETLRHAVELALRSE